ncbi:hypothetical protein CALCODRAFT_504492 [Calocera cornea HHB12733]|uniref:Clavaminate synthase-like protein n=1 Tax=Calocera cornea HHB12733 TaxID=1353952 RepID=A0A165CDH0_9BASI|nr:hypothetical protein CALCODRAFT_504492 [Calocera cornea HHB12733]
MASEGFTIKVDAKKRGYKVLTQEQVDHFMEKGYVKLPGAIPEETMKKWTADLWVRLGMDPNDKSTWDKEELHMPTHKSESMKTFAPLVYEACGDLLGGTDKIAAKSNYVGNGFICNLGSPDFDPNERVDPRDLTNWHVDGDWFRHFLDCECQALETLILWSDVEDRAGPTYVNPDGIAKVAAWLRDHPEGSDTMTDENGDKIVPKIVKSCNVFEECIGKKGDVFLCHPLMPHSRQKNYIRNERFITNPCVNRNEPYNLNRENPDDYCLVELKTLHDLNANAVDYKPQRERARWVPTTLTRANKTIEVEVKRMKEYSEKTGAPFESVHANGIDNTWLIKARDIPMTA